MPRVKRGTLAHKKREKLLRKTKGFKWGRKSKERAAKEALLHSLSRSFRGRKEKKRTFRDLAKVKINAACRLNGTTYSRFIAGLKSQNIKLNRQVLSGLAQNHPEVLEAVIVRATKQ